MKFVKKICLALILCVFSFGIFACGQPATSNYSLNLKADKEIACPGEAVQFTTEFIGDQLDLKVTYVLKEGKDFATISEQGLLTIKEDAPSGEEVVVVSKTSEKTSNSVKVKIATKLESIGLTAESNQVVVGNSIVLNATLNPNDALAEPIKFEVLEGKDACSMVNNLLVVNQNAEVGTVIKVKAVSGAVESNVLELTVISGMSDRLLLSLSSSSLTIDKFAGNATLLYASILDAEYNEVTDKKVVFEVIEGNENLAVSYENNACSFTALGHGKAVVRATIEGTTYSKTAVIDVIVPPTALQLHEVFADRLGFEYNFSKVDALKFPVEILGENVCEEISLSFEDQLGNKGDAVASYNPETQEITFHSTGKVKVTATSASGSRKEASVSYTFNINEGINVYTFEQLKKTLESSSYNGQIVNIVVLEKPQTDAYEYEYGYDLVPSFALKAASEQTFANLTSENLGGISAINKSVYINGNQHKIDASQVRNFTTAECDANGWLYKELNPILIIQQSSSGVIPKAVEVKLYDLTVLGNSAIDYKGEVSGKLPVGSYSRGIQIGMNYGANYQAYRCAYYVDIENITVAQCSTGMRIYHAINGTAKNINVYNCFGNGIESYANIITFENMTYGLCGAAGIELTPNNDAEAGIDFDQKQQVTFAGSITTTNYSSGQSLYMQNFGAMGLTVMQILQGVFSQYSPEVLENVRNENGEFAFISFVFNDLTTMQPNESKYEYKNIDGAGIININELTGIDTIHKYIEVDVLVGQGMSVGKVLVYTFNYQGN